MSSILIKGATMPKCCLECAGRRPSFNGVYCWVISLPIHDLTHRHPDCPLVEIPPHGRLIDADKLVQYMEERQERLNDDKALWELSVVDTFLSDAPTVIESEEE